MNRATQGTPKTFGKDKTSQIAKNIKHVKVTAFIVGEKMHTTVEHRRRGMELTGKLSADSERNAGRRIEVHTAEENSSKLFLAVCLRPCLFVHDRCGLDEGARWAGRGAV